MNEKELIKKIVYHLLKHGNDFAESLRNRDVQPDVAGEAEEIMKAVRTEVQKARKLRNCGLCKTEIALAPCTHILIADGRVTLSVESWEKLTQELAQLQANQKEEQQ